MGRAEEDLEILREVHREGHEKGEMGNLKGAGIPLGAAMVLSGEMAAGIRWIENECARFLPGRGAQSRRAPRLAAHRGQDRRGVRRHELLIINQEVCRITQKVHSIPKQGNFLFKIKPLGLCAGNYGSGG